MDMSPANAIPSPDIPLVSVGESVPGSSVRTPAGFGGVGWAIAIPFAITAARTLPGLAREYAQGRKEIREQFIMSQLRNDAEAILNSNVGYGDGNSGVRRAAREFNEFYTMDAGQPEQLLEYGRRFAQTLADQLDKPGPAGDALRKLVSDNIKAHPEAYVYGQFYKAAAADVSNPANYAEFLHLAKTGYFDKTIEMRQQQSAADTSAFFKSMPSRLANLAITTGSGFVKLLGVISEGPSPEESLAYGTAEAYALHPPRPMECNPIYAGGQWMDRQKFSVTDTSAAGQMFDLTTNGLLAYAAPFTMVSMAETMREHYLPDAATTETTDKCLPPLDTPAKPEQHSSLEPRAARPGLATGPRLTAASAMAPAPG